MDMCSVVAGVLITKKCHARSCHPSSSILAEQTVSRRKFIKGVLLAGGLGAASLALPESIIPSAQATGTTNVAPASYIVENSSGTITAYHCNTEFIDYSGTNAASVIQSAINNLTSGRNWKEKVVLKGDMTLTTGLTIPGFTIIEHLGRLSYTDSGSAIAIQNAKNVELHSPFIDLAGAGSSAVGIESQGLWHGDIYSPRVENGGANAVGMHWP